MNLSNLQNSLSSTFTEKKQTQKNDTPKYYPPPVQCCSHRTSHSHPSDLIENPFVFALYNASKWLHQEAQPCDLLSKQSLAESVCG